MYPICEWNVFDVENNSRTEFYVIRTVHIIIIKT